MATGASEAVADPLPDTFEDPGYDTNLPEQTSTAEAIALDEARASGASVEVESLRGESTEVFATPEGELEAFEYLRPVWARVDGEWEEVDTTLEFTEDGGVAPRATTAELAFSGGGDGPLVELERSGRELALVWPEELPTPELNGDTAVYRDVLPGVDLRLAAQPDGFSQLIVVNDAQAAANPLLGELRLGLASTGVVPEVAPDGGIQALDANADTPVFEAPVPLMWDSSSGGGEEAAAFAAVDDEDAAVGPPGAGESSNLAHVGASINTERDALTLTPDEDVLLGEDTVYPVYIDPQWHSPRTTSWTMVSRYWANSPQWKFNGESNAGMGYCGWAACMPRDLKRLMYQLPVAHFNGARITKAEFSVRNVHSASCAPQEVELWRTAAISSRTTWNSQNTSSFWKEQVASDSFSYGYEGCAAADAEFNVRSLVQEAADNGLSSLTFGLRAADETEPLSWKRFSDRAHLRVLYNRTPRQIKPSQLIMEYGGACRPASSAPRTGQLGQIHARNVTDPDGEDLAVQFAAGWDAGDGRGNVVRWDSELTTEKSSGSTFSVDLPENIPPNVMVEWHVRSYDGTSYSRWSSSGNGYHACHFVYDTSMPAGPVISSAAYPEFSRDDPFAPWHQGTGHYGRFTLTASDNDVNKYVYWLDGDAPTTVTTTGGAARTINLVPANPSEHVLTAMTFDSANNPSTEVTYIFRVAAGAGPRARWQSDEPAGGSGSAAVVPARWASLTGTATLGVAGSVGTGLQVDGATGFAATTGPVVDTSGSFSVSVWAKLNVKPTRAAVVATQAGRHQPGFELYYSAAQDSWAFNQYRVDASGQTSTARVLAPNVDVVAGQWAHLVGSYDKPSGQLRFYVNGQLAGTTSYTDAWNAYGRVLIGAGETDGTPRSFFPGVIDEVQVFDFSMPSVNPYVTRLFNKQRLRDIGRPAVALFPLDEASGRRVTGAGEALAASYHGGVQAGVPGVHGRAARYNGTDAYAATTTGMIDTSRNFAVSAWARLDRAPGAASVVATQTGTHQPGFELYYTAAFDRWAFAQYSDDTPSGTVVRAMQPDGQTAREEEWTHLVGVHDSYAQTLTLYVNGIKSGSVKLDTPFAAGGEMQIGAGQTSGTVRSFFPGTIDDVRVFDRVVTDYEIRQIYLQAPIVRARWQLDGLDTDDVASTPDATAFGNDLFLWGGAGMSPGFVDDASLYVDGGGGYAYAPDVPIDTSSSFTVTGFARAASPPTSTASVLSAVGQRESAFAIRFEPDPQEEGFGRWQASLNTQDNATTTVTRIAHQRLYDVRAWHHLALVYDKFAGQALLYVDGELEEVTCLDAEDTTCTPGTSLAENVYPFQAQGSLHVGRSLSGGVWREPWPGAIDDVWAIQGVLSGNQIRDMSLGQPDAPTEIPPPPVEE